MGLVLYVDVVHTHDLRELFFLCIGMMVSLDHQRCVSYMYAESCWMIALIMRLELHEEKKNHSKDGTM